ncbi:cytochrome P450 [Striga asiatica]|uniref:Cytochrome P450 n=1 Tax=Striga asiatica TaxID=4170 RepID=A0A5A7PVI3_STRAF|nr:cytochrome P450 [Striga asiatica]
MKVFHLGPATSSDHSLTFFSASIPLPHQLRRIFSGMSASDTEIRSQFSLLREIEHGKFHKTRIHGNRRTDPLLSAGSPAQRPTVASPPCPEIDYVCPIGIIKRREEQSKTTAQKEEDSPSANPSAAHKHTRSRSHIIGKFGERDDGKPEGPSSTSTSTIGDEVCRMSERAYRVVSNSRAINCCAILKGRLFRRLRMGDSPQSTKSASRLRMSLALLQQSGTSTYVENEQPDALCKMHLDELKRGAARVKRTKVGSCKVSQPDSDDFVVDAPKHGLERITNAKRVKGRNELSENDTGSS